MKYETALTDRYLVFLSKSFDFKIQCQSITFLLETFSLGYRTIGLYIFMLPTMQLEQ